MRQKNYYLGIDIGSVSVKVAVLNDERKIIYTEYERHKGKPAECLLQALAKVEDKFTDGNGFFAYVTGTGGKLISSILEIGYHNEIITLSKALNLFYPQVNTVIEMGGEDSKILLYKREDKTGELTLEDFAMNTLCAAGTGSFLDQQANRLNVNIEGEFGEMAIKSENPPRIAGRCSVFAKSDMIHLQQIATPDYDIVAGLCYAVARNFKGNIAKGKEFVLPIAFVGGVAANIGVVKAFEDILELAPGELLIPEHFSVLGAIGAALLCLDNTQKGKETYFAGSKKLKAYLENLVYGGKGLASLVIKEDEMDRVIGKKEIKEIGNAANKVDAFLGVDIGSISTNVIVMDKDKNVLARRYLMTAGRPIEAVRQGIDEVGREIADKVNILGVGTTGSGRYMIGELIGADVIRNEITAQAIAALNIDPEVDTIFEIGGQDSKYISLSEGVVTDFEMNKVCAAGTGSFLEEQAEKLNINIKEQFGSLALSAKNPVRLGERCTVFMEADLVSHQQSGANKDDLVAGLSYSIVYNYLNRVVGDRKIGKKIFFQGGVAANLGVVAAFQQVTGKEITVPPHHDVTGAIGVAILAKENYEQNKVATRFQGFDFARKSYAIKSFECKSCANLCEINSVALENGKQLFYGSRCEKYDLEKKQKVNDIPDLFAEREKLLLKQETAASIAAHPRRNKIKIGIPYVLNFHEYFPFWRTFFATLGFEVVSSAKTNKGIIRSGVEGSVAETCFPIKVSLGHVYNLLEKDVDYIFTPSIINMIQPNPKLTESQACPYVQSFPYLVRGAVELGDRMVKFLQPAIHLRYGRKVLLRSLKEMALELGCSQREMERALIAAENAQQEFYAKLQQRGREVIDNLQDNQRALVIVGRPYNSCDGEINLAIPKKLRDMGVLAIPMDFLPLDEVDVSEEVPDMYWRYGQKIYAAATFIRKHPNLHAVYITNFGCGPDSFISHFFRKKMSGKPYLQLEIDEHSADAGAITRCEAFLDSLHNKAKGGEQESKISTVRQNSLQDSKRKVYLPNMVDHAYVLKAAFEASGIEAEVLQESDAKTVEIGRKYTSGKECFPCIVTTGDFVKKMREHDFAKSKAAFFMPSADGPCRFGMYNALQQLIAKELGHNDVVFISPDSDNSYSDVGIDFRRRAFQGIVAVDFLQKLCWHTRPYEIKKGETDQVYKQCLDDISNTIAQKGKLKKAIQRSIELFKGIKVDRSVQKPLIGVVGEIFLRANRFSNNQVVRQIEELGGEVRVAPISEWIMYTSHIYKKESFSLGNYRSYLLSLVEDGAQKFYEHEIAKFFEGITKDMKDASTEEVLSLSSPYIHESFAGEAVLSIGKTIDYIQKGFAGVVNVMPFTCMPGTIVTGLLKKIKEDYDNFPFITMAYDGLEQASDRTRLETFMYQAQQYDKKNKKEKSNVG